MADSWKKRNSREREKIWARADRVDWCCALCKVLIFYGERHPEAKIDILNAPDCLRDLAYASAENVILRKDKSGFSYTFYGRNGHKYYYISNEGLPAIPTNYEEESA